MSLILVHLSIVGMSGIQLTMWNDGNISPGNCGSCIMDLGSLCHMALLSGSLGGGKLLSLKLVVWSTIGACSLIVWTWQLNPNPST